MRRAGAVGRRSDRRVGLSRGHRLPGHRVVTRLRLCGGPGRALPARRPSPRPALSEPAGPLLELAGAKEFPVRPFRTTGRGPPFCRLPPGRYRRFALHDRLAAPPLRGRADLRAAAALHASGVHASKRLRAEPRGRPRSRLWQQPRRCSFRPPPWDCPKRDDSERGSRDAATRPERTRRRVSALSVPSTARLARATVAARSPFPATCGVVRISADG